MLVKTNPGALFIRSAGWSDHDVVYAFLCELENEVLDRSAFQTVFRHNITAEGVYYLVAELAGEVIGFVSCHAQYLLHHVGEVGEIQELFVRASHRNQRVGHQLIRALDALAADHGFVNLEVTTNRVRTDTHRFYEQVGFRQTHLKFVKAYQ